MIPEKRELLSIGQLAKRCEVSCKTLRYYDRIDLIQPILVAEDTGYRYYMEEQASTISLIKQLQEIGVSLEEIKAYLNKSEYKEMLESLEKLLEQQEEQIRVQLASLQERQKKIKGLRDFCSLMTKEVLMKPNQYTRKYIEHPSKIIYKQYKGKYEKSIFRNHYTEMIKTIKEQPVETGIEKISSIPIALTDGIDEKGNIDLSFISMKS